MESVLRALIEMDAVDEVDENGRTAIFYAVSSIAVQTLITAGANVNISDNEGRTPLMYAILYNKHSNVVRALIDAGADVNISDDQDRPALFYAVKFDNESMVGILIDAGANVNIADNEGKTALFYSFSENMINRLVDVGAEVNQADYGGQSALLYAVMKNKENAAHALIKAGASVNVTDNENDSILFHAVMYNNESLIDALVKAGADINRTDKEGKTPLHFALTYEKERATRALKEALTSERFVNERKTALFDAVSKKEVQALIEAGALINIIDDKGKTPLHQAIVNKNAGVASALIAAGAEINITDDDGATPLMYACLNDNETEVAQALIDVGAEVNVTDSEGKTALFYVNDNLCMANSLIDAGADINVKNIKGKTALFHAIKNNSATLALALINAGSDVNITDNKGKTPLLHVVRNDTEIVVQALIKAGADVNVVCDNGNPVLFYAVLHDNENVVQMLIKAGADVNIVYDDGNTVLFYAVSNPTIVQALIEDGNAFVNARDIYGRTPLFYAITQSVSLCSYLIEKGANLFVKDNCNVSILSYCIESLMSKYADLQNPLSPSDMQGGLELLQQHGVDSGTVFKATINVVFSKILSFYSLKSSGFSNKDDIKSLSKILELARDYLPNENSGSMRLQKENIIETILGSLNNEFTDVKNYYESLVPNILPQLIELGANPNSADSDGNTALHYVTRLPFLGVPKETVIDIYRQLKTFEAKSAINNQNETPLLFCLSREVWEIAIKKHQWSGVKTLVDICRCLLEDGSNVQQTSRTGESVFHLILELFQQGLKQDKAVREDVLNEAMQLLHLFSSKCKSKGQRGIAVNRRDIHLNSPLHIWASLALESVHEYQSSSTLTKNYTFEEFLKLILGDLLSCGAKLNDKNEIEQTPLHLCRTWSAVKLLLAAGANPSVTDLLGRSPLLASAKNLTFIHSADHFYPDVLLEPEAFWKTALENNLDPWVVDQHGKSVLSVLIKSNDFVLAKALLEVGCEKNYLQSSDILAVALLNAICKDQSTYANWKSILVKIILKSKSSISRKTIELTPLHCCCRNIVKLFTMSKKTHYKSIHWTIAKQLLWYGADPAVPDPKGQSCLDIAQSCPDLKDLLIKPIDINEIPLLIPWLSVSKRYKPILAKAARRQECEHVEPFWYHKNHLESGSFGLVFAGINERDGREVAIKRVERRRMVRREDKREITNLTALADCEQVVRYFSFFEDEHFSYIVLELMEGNLDEYLDCALTDKTSILLFNDIVIGLKYLHWKNILHRDLKPTNILYKTHPQLCLKIADFGLSRRIDSASITVYGSNAGTRCWIAPELLTSTKDHSKSSDIFSCGLILHYILSVKKHPYAPANCCKKSTLQVKNETEANVIHGNMEGWDTSSSSEATHLIKMMLDSDESKRPTAAEALAHPKFWSKKNKIEFLTAVGNQPEFECPRTKRSLPLTAVEIDTDKCFGIIVKYGRWNDPGFVHMPVIYTEMMKKRKSPYDTCSVVELVRFIRNAIAHVSSDKRPTPIKKLLLEDFLFLEYFPNLVMEVYKAVTTHGWDQREEIKYAIMK